MEKKGQQEWSSSSASSPRVTCSAASSSRLAVCPRLSVWCSSSSSVAAATSNALSATRRAAAEDASVCRRRPATRRSATERRDTPPEKGGGSPDEDARAPPRENHRGRDIAHAPSARSSPTRARPRSPHDSTPTASASPRWSSVVVLPFEFAVLSRPNLRNDAVKRISPRLHVRSVRRGIRVYPSGPPEWRNVILTRRSLAPLSPRLSKASSR